jgi:hypothetical protein
VKSGYWVAPNFSAIFWPLFGRFLAAFFAKMAKNQPNFSQ